MAESQTLDGRPVRPFDPLATGAAIFFALALLFGAYPALRAGPASMGGLLLLFGLAGVAFFTILAFRGAEGRGAEEPGADALIAEIRGSAGSEMRVRVSDVLVPGTSRLMPIVVAGAWSASRR